MLTFYFEIFFNEFQSVSLHFLCLLCKCTSHITQLKCQSQLQNVTYIGIIKITRKARKNSEEDKGV